MEIKRDLYLKKLISHKNNGLVKVITGLRRSGKTYLLFKLFFNYLLETGVKKDHIIKIALDDWENKSLRNPNNIYNYISDSIRDDNNYYILIDEVQLLENFQDILNGLLHKENVDLYITGSNAKFLSKDIMTEFRGRGDQIHLMPLSYQELYDNYEGDKTNLLDNYMCYGGLPKVWSFDDDIEKTAYLKSVFQETYLLDIIERYDIRNQVEFMELLEIIASCIGSFVNPNKIASTFLSEKKVKISANTISTYLNYIEDAFIVSHSSRFDIKGRKYINSLDKIYFSDLGIRNLILNFRQMEQTHLQENLIYNELIRRGFSVDVGFVDINEKKDGKYVSKRVEVDFVANLFNSRIYVQSALAIPTREKVQQEERPFISITDSFKKIIVVKDNIIPYFTEEGTEIVGLHSFLTRGEL